MLAPQAGAGTSTLLLSPDHVGTVVPVLVAWLILDRARPRWYVPVVVGALLAWALVADALILSIAILPAAALTAVAAAALLSDALRAAGGYRVVGVGVNFAGAAALASHAAYWEASVTTLSSRGRVQVSPGVRRPRPVPPGDLGITGLLVRPARRYANFIVIGQPAACDLGSAAEAVRAFGRPARAYRVAGYMVLVWHQNLLARLG
jgi:hypothetical protein